jgi:hypothetical protein
VTAARSSGAKPAVGPSRRDALVCDFAALHGESKRQPAGRDSAPPKRGQAPLEDESTRQQHY